MVVLFVVAPLWYMVVLSLDPDPVGGAAGMIPRRVSFDNYRLLTSDVFGVLPRAAAQPRAVGGDDPRQPADRDPCRLRPGPARVRGKELILALMLAFAFFPGSCLVVPIAKVFADIGWLDHLAPIGLAQLSFTLPLAVWLLTYAFRAVPQEVEDAALMDGARTVQRIVVGGPADGPAPGSAARSPWCSSRPGTTSSSPAR